MFIYRVIVTLNTFGWSVKVQEPIEVVETAKSYTANGLRVSKAGLGLPRTKLHEYAPLYSYDTYCLAYGIDAAKENLTQHILARFNKEFAVMEQIQKHTQQ